MCLLKTWIQFLNDFWVFSICEKLQHIFCVFYLTTEYKSLNSCFSFLLFFYWISAKLWWHNSLRSEILSDFRLLASKSKTFKWHHILRPRFEIRNDLRFFIRPIEKGRDVNARAIIYSALERGTRWECERGARALIFCALERRLTKLQLTARS